METQSAEEGYLSPELLRLVVDLEKELAGQREHLKKVEEKTAQIEKRLKILINELIQAGYINVPERRQLLKRNLVNHEALINLLKKKGIVSKREFIREVKQLVRSTNETKKNAS